MWQTITLTERIIMSLYSKLVQCSVNSYMLMECRIEGAVLLEILKQASHVVNILVMIVTACTTIYCCWAHNANPCYCVFANEAWMCTSDLFMYRIRTYLICLYKLRFVFTDTFVFTAITLKLIKPPHTLLALP